MPIRNRSFKLPFSFHTKIFIVLGGVVCISIVSILFILQETTKNHIQENIRERFQGSHAAFRHLQSMRRQFVVDAINNLTTSNAQFRSILSTASVSTNALGLEKSEGENELLKDANLRLNSFLPFLPMYREFEIFIVTNADGTLLFSKASTRRFGDDISDLPLFEQFSENEEAEDIWFSNARDVNRFLIPSKTENGVYHLADFRFRECYAFLKAKKLLETVAVVAPGGMLGNKNRVSLGRGLSAVVLWFGGGETLVHKVGGMQAQNVHAT